MCIVQYLDSSKEDAAHEHEIDSPGARRGEEGEIHGQTDDRLAVRPMTDDVDKKVLR